MRALASIAMTVVVAVASGLAIAGEPQGQHRERGGGMAMERMRELNLSDAQTMAIAAIREEYGPKVEEAAFNLAAVLKDEVAEIRTVLTPEQKVKLWALKEEWKIWRIEGVAERLAHLRDIDLTDEEFTKLADIRKEYRPKIQKELDGLKGILTPEQAKVREDGLRAGLCRRDVLASLKLSDDQKSKVEAVGTALCDLVRQELEAMRNVLDPAQRETLAAIKEERRDQIRDRMAFAIASFKDLSLTDDQKAKLEAIRTEYRPKVHQAGNELRAIVREELAAIISVVKTDHVAFAR